MFSFSSGGSPPIPIWFSIGYLAVGFPIRKSPDHSSFAAPRSLSQLITSFIGSWCQGIPLALLLAWPSRKIHSSGFSSRIMQAHLKEVSLAKIVIITLLIKSFPLLLPSHNCINNSQCSVFKVHSWASFSRDSMKFLIPQELQSISF